ncbi:sulfotransferase domain-containing protein [Allorhodopirellula solitaria]|uniref:Sulfotransferase domain protein n=1 Tax=Allorhodopirellula solitaria TaxID=2527987 RepID=A0A5C5YDA8_9BACT|nr:sulfotransferase domain-containing protein [Allorhodopirellula solitaria]TWT72938.1 Sulfotransferase domain protein [Allorhodopirellula solitaria]
MPDLNKPAVLVATHPRSGTHLTIDLLRRNFPDLASKKKRGESLDSLYVPIDIVLGRDPSAIERTQRLVERHDHPILKSHWLNPDYANLIAASADLGQWVAENAKVIYVVREPHRVLASHYLFESSHRDVDGDLQAWFDHACRYWCRHVRGWLSTTPSMVLRFEQIISEPSETVRELSDVLELPARAVEPMLPPKLRSKWLGRWYRVTGTSAPSTEILTPGQGASFDSLFGDLDMTVFESLVLPLAEQVGYE